MYIYIYSEHNIHVYMYVYIYIERERDDVQTICNIEHVCDICTTDMNTYPPACIYSI